MEKTELLKLMSAGTHAEKFRLGDVLFREGDPADSGLCLVLSGSVNVTQAVEGQSITLGRIHAGEFLGETALVLKRPRSATATVSSDEAVIMFLTKERVLDEAHRNFPFLSTLLMEGVARMEHVLQVLMRQPGPLHFVVDPTLAPIMDENRRYLMKIPNLLNHTRNMFVGNNKPVFTLGQKNDGVLHLVTDGVINLEKTRPDEAPMVLHQITAGDFFGFSRPSSCPVRFFTAVARGESAHVISCDEELLNRVFRLDMEIAWCLFRAIIVKLVMLNDSLHAVAAPRLDRVGTADTDRAIRAAFASAPRGRDGCADDAADAADGRTGRLPVIGADEDEAKGG
jgi:CRP-like cAMP-binding protein